MTGPEPEPGPGPSHKLKLNFTIPDSSILPNTNTTHKHLHENNHELDLCPPKNSHINNPLIISLGIDCGPKMIIKDYSKITQETFPFDWCRTYKGVSSIIKNGYTNLLSNPIPSIDDESYNDNVNGIKFRHNGKLIKGNYVQDTNKEKTLDEVKEKYIRRLERLYKYLDAYNTSINHQQLIFVRKSHDDKDHIDAENYDIDIKNDIDDAIELNHFLSTKYSKLNYVIIFFRLCVYVSSFSYYSHYFIRKFC